MTDVKQSKSEEIDPDDLAEAEIDSGPEDTIKEPVEALGEQVSELKDQLLRSVAELDNYRKRAEREKEQLRKFGIANFAKDLLSVADNLRRAVESGPSDLEGADESVKNLIRDCFSFDQDQRPSSRDVAKSLNKIKQANRDL